MGHAVRSFTAHGLYALMQLAQSTEGVDQASQLVAKGIELQSSEIESSGRLTSPSPPSRRAGCAQCPEAVTEDATHPRSAGQRSTQPASR